MDQDDADAAATRAAPPALDPLATDYVRLAFGIERHVPGYVDAYHGPAAIRDDALAGDPPLPLHLLAAARDLVGRVAEAAIAESRVGYLTAQLQAMIATCRRLAGETLSYPDEVKACFDVDPETTPDAVFDAAIAELDGLLPGDGTTAERMARWKERFVVAPETARTLLDTIGAESRRRTAAFVDLPEGESVAYALVSDRPWGGYNWYLGNGRSRVELNTDLPIHANGLTDLVCHESYPGHHTEHAMKERLLYRALGYGEHAIQVINTPECVIAEGIATLAASVIFSGEELYRWQTETLYPLAGITGDPERESSIAAAKRALGGVSLNAALLLHRDGAPEAEVLAYLERYGLKTEAEARQGLRFLADPLWRAYPVTYRAGHALLGRWLDAAGPETRQVRFKTLLTEQVTPSSIANETEGLGG